MSANWLRWGPILVLALTAVTSCGGGNTGASQNESATPMDRTFVSTEVQGPEIPGGGQLKLSFRDGRISGSAGCNTHSGPVVLDEHKIAVSDLAGTLMACPDERQRADEWLVGLLRSTPSWSLENDTLTVQNDDLTVTMVDQRIANPARPLRGTTWTVDALRTPDAHIRSRAIDESQPTLTIADDGAVTGSTGCNRMTGQATMNETPEGTEVAFQVATTKMMCPPEVMEVEQSVLRTLDGTINAEIESDTLTLSNPNGYGLELRAR